VGTTFFLFSLQNSYFEFLILYSSKIISLTLYEI